MGVPEELIKLFHTLSCGSTVRIVTAYSPTPSIRLHRGLRAGQRGKRCALYPPPRAPRVEPFQLSPRLFLPRGAAPGTGVLRRPPTDSTHATAISGVRRGDCAILGGHGHVPQCADDRPLDLEGQLLVWDRHVLPRDLRGAVHQVPVHMDRDYRQFAAWCPDQLENVIFIAGATVLLNNVSLRDLGVVPGMLLEMRARLTGGGGGAGDSHPMAALAVFCVQKYATWREYLAGCPMTAGGLTRAIEKMIGRFAGDMPSPLRNVSVTCPGLEPPHMWALLGCFETYAGALLDFSVMRYVQVRREEYHDAEDWDALQEARREYDEVEHHVRLEGANRKEQDGHLRDSSDDEEEERPYEVLSLENVRKIRKRPCAPKWTARLSKALRDYLQQPEKTEQHSLANAIWGVMRKMDRQGSAYLKEEWKKKHKKEKKRRRKERKKAKKAGHKSKKGKGRKSRDTESSSGSSSDSSTSSDSLSSSQSSARSGRQKATQPASAGRKRKVEIRVVDGRREFWSKKRQQWIDYTNPPEVPCPK